MSTISMLLKNEFVLKHKPVQIAGVEKVLISNSCSANSLLTLLTCFTVDSENYCSYLTFI